jgi:predicted SAM-dependent methyltransferase
MTREVKLDIGSGGPSPLGPDWIGIDSCCVGADVTAEMSALPFDDDCVHAVFSSHALEHVGKRHVPFVLAEWFRVLKAGGRLTIRVPDLEWCCRWWLDHQDDGWDLDVLFGNQAHDGEYHKTGFNEAILRDQAERAGFCVLSVTRILDHGQITLHLEATKP